MTAPYGGKGAPPRHDKMDDLVALSIDPAPRKTRRIEWVGEPSLLDDPIVAFNLLMGLYTPIQEKAVRRAAQRRKCRVHGSRLMEKDHQYAMATVKGLHRTYLFEKANRFICDVDYHDVDILLGSPSGHEFVDLDALDPDQPVEMVVPQPMDVFDSDLFVVVDERRVRTDDARIAHGERIASHA